MRFRGISASRKLKLDSLPRKNRNKIGLRSSTMRLHAIILFLQADPANSTLDSSGNGEEMEE